MTTVPIQTRTTTTRRERWAWYLYDFGNSAYASVVLLAVYSAYFQGSVVGGAEGSRLWGLAVGIAMLVVAVTSPILGTIADFSGSKKKFLLFYTVMACIFTAGLFFAEPGNVAIGMSFFILAEIGYRSAQVFYNSLLPEIAEPHEVGRVSGNGWAIGTVGGILCLIIILPLIVMIEGDLIIRTSLVITAVFFAISAAPIFLWLPERAKAKSLPPGENYFGYAFKQLAETIKTASQFKEFLKFMAAFLIFNDGVIMALNFAAIIGAVLYGMDQQQLIIFVIIVQVSNVGGAYAFGSWVDKLGGKRSLALSIVTMIAAVIWLYLNNSATGFYLLGILAGFAMAGIQSVSRTMVSFFAPPGRSAEFYGFFAVAGRTSSFIGPTVYGLIAAEAALWYQTQGESITSAEQLGQKLAILSIGVFLVVGLIVLSFVNEKKARSFE
ncbi:MFS transporter [Candidatus Leptofilum sp.]|uniref:MFS transporter n=1 Tax=Candidatus Leptofilum sp. TaxID=3241576 RepID=UPI003B5C3C7A